MNETPEVYSLIAILRDVSRSLADRAHLNPMQQITVASFLAWGLILAIAMCILAKRKL
jgi:hypothetical protein